jgi:tRNA A37 threonylcarbamoyladenosine biosynthesis protein TsaE
MHSDQPTLSDNLNRIPLIERKAIEITDCSTPQNFGIHGDWGSGKTSFLRQLRYHLDGSKVGCQSVPSPALISGKYKEEVITIWFDAWRYQHEASPVIALLQEIRNQFCLWAKAKGKAKKLGEITIKSILNTFDDITKVLKIESIPINSKGIQKTGETWEKEHLEQRLNTDNVLILLQQAINTLLKEFRGRTSKRLVIFIDDLDRCNSSTAYRLLEGIKVYLDLENCVFVFGLNQKVVTESIAKEVTTSLVGNTETELRILAEAYLEKICSSFERLSPPENNNELFLQLIEPNYLIHFTNALLNANGHITCLPPNPRKIKALANLINQWLPRVTALQGYSANKEQYLQASLVVGYIYQYHSDLFHKLQFTHELYNTIKRWASTQLGDSENNSSSILKAPPSFLLELKLPFIIESDDTSAAVTFHKRSSYPDPFSINMFWAQELIIDGDFDMTQITEIIKIIS